MSWTQQDTSFKKLQNKRVTTSTGKGINEEKGASTLELYLPDIKTDLIPGIPPGTSTSVLSYTGAIGQTLVVDTSVPGNLTWFATTGYGNTTVANDGTQSSEQARLMSWISDKYDAFGTVSGAGYEIKVYDKNSNLITKTDPSDWLFDYQTGILAFNNASTAYGTVATSGPYRIVGYRYIGNKGIITGAYGGLGFTTYNFGDILVGAGSTFIKLPLGSNNYILSVSTSSATGLSWVANSGGGGAGTVYNGSLNAIPYYPAAGTAITGSINFTNTGTGISIAYSTASLSTTTGALTVAGGVGIGGSLYTSSSYANSISGVVLSNGVKTSGSWAGSTITGLYGGTGYTSYTKGDILVGAGNTFVKFGVGTNNYVLGASSASGSGLTWRTASSATATTSIAPSNPLSGDIWYDSSDGSLSVYYDDGNTSQWVEVAGAFTGTVGLGYTYSIPYYDVTGIGITGSTSFQNVGTGISILYAANSISTATGALVVSGGVGIGGSIYTSTSNAASISGVVLSNNIITSGSWAGSTITARYGGTGYTTYTTGDILVGSGSTFIKLGVGSSGQYLISDPASSSGIAWTTLSVAATGITGINGLTATTQFFATGTTGIGFNISSSGSTHTFNIPIAGTGVTGLITGTAQTIAGQKTFTSSIIGDLTGTATTATYALQSGFAITSGLATTSNYALQSGYAVTSGLATTASYAYQSGYAITSGLATTATYSNQSGYAITSGFATTSNNVNVVNSTSNTTHSLLFTPGSGTLSGAALSSNSTVSFNPSTFVLSTPGLAVTSSTASTSYNTGALVVAGGVGIGGSLYVNGDLTINGTTTTINSVTLTVDDKNIELGSVSSPSDVTAEAGGITLKGTSDKFINWYTGTGWSSNQDWNLASGLVYKINNTSVLSASSLGTGVTNSSLTAVGTITTGTWAGSLIAGLYGGTGYSSYTKGDILVGAGSTFIKLAVGTDNFVLTADATTASGVKWSSVAGLSITSVNGLTASAQFFSTGSSGTGFNISSSGSTHTFNIPIAGTGATGLVSTLAQSFAGTKTFTGDVIVSSTTGSTAYNTGSLTVYGGLGVSGQLSFNQAALGYTGATNPSIAFIGSTTAAPITLTVLSDNSLLWEGTSGKLFGINNNLSSGWIFNVGDISGLPIIRANADGTIAMAEFAANVGIGLSNPSYKLHVVGDTNLSSGYVYRINGTSVLSATSLGTGVTNSSLTAVGTLTTGTWAATAITALYGGTGLVPSFTVGDILYANTSSTWGRLAANSNSGYVLTSAGSGATPTYVAPSTLSVGFATTAGFATTSSYAYQSGYAITSGLATTATYSHQSGYAITSGFATTAGLATTATYAHQSGYAITSGFATSSTSASIATTSTNINVVSATTSASHRVLFTPAAGTASGAAVSTESSFVYNPSTDILSVSGLAVTSGTASTNSNTGALVVTGGVGIGGSLFVGGDLTINGTTTTINSVTLTVDDKNIELGSVSSPSDVTAEGGGITLKGTTDKYINWYTGTGWSSSESFNLASGNTYKINNTAVLSASSLGTGVTNSSLTALGTITTGTWAGSTITSRYGGTGYTTYTKGDLLVGAGGTLAKLPVGSNLTILAADSSSGTGLTWKGLLNPSYGAFGSTATQQVAAANTETLVSYNLTYEANNVSIGSGTTTRVYINDSGVFNIQFSAQVALASGTQPKNLDMWFKVNGVNVPQSNTRQTIAAKDQETIFALNFVSTFISGQYIELAYSSPDANIQLGSYSGLTTPTRPDIPSMILTVTPVSSLLPGSGVAITGLASLNLLTSSVQTFATGTSGVDFNILSTSGVHTFNIPDASTTARGLITTGAQTLLGSKTFASGVAITASTVSSSSTTGALVVNGGVGIGGTVYTATDLNVGNSTTGRLFFSQATLGSAGTTVIPSMAFIGATNSPITLSVLADNSLSFDGSSGQLFSINNNLSTGWIFAVNDISGLPLLRANADGTVAMGEFAGNIGIGLSNPSYKLHVAGDTNLSSGNVYRINGTSVLSSTSLGTGVTNSSLTALGTITTGTWAGSTITARYGGTGYTTYTTGDILVGAGSTFVKVGSGSTNYVLSSSSIYPVGVGWTWVSAVGVGTNPPSNTHDSDLWWNATDGTLNLYYNDGDSSQWVEISGGNGIDLSQPVHITSTEASTSVSTGALVVDGGVGIQGELHTASLVINGTYDVVGISTTLASSGGTQPIHTLSASTYRSVKYMVQVTHGSDYQVQELLLLQDGIDTYLTQYAQLLSGNNLVLATYDADLNGGNMRLLVAPTYTNTTFKIYGTAVRL